MACHHPRLEAVAKAHRTDDTVEEHCGLGHTGLFQLLVSAVEHDVCDAEAKDFVGPLEEVLGNGMIFVEDLAHSYELGALTGENISFHRGKKYCLM